MKLALFDYGAGNLHSLGKALEGAGASVEITPDWPTALSAQALVLPGVGAFGPAVGSLGEYRDEVRSALLDGYPCLGICLGMQLLFGESDEALGSGIGLIAGRVERLDAPVVPQMGWNDVETSDDPLLDGLEAMVAYYANSFVCRPRDPEVVIATSEYGGERFAAAVRRERTWGVQFHPEKSTTLGLRVLENFLREAGR